MAKIKSSMSFYDETLCLDCRHLRKIENKRGSVFLMCRLSADDDRFQRYPPQPVYDCKGFVDAVDKGGDKPKEWGGD